ncbi:acyl-CoA dehydrogenase [Gordonia jinghuaiqii]|uniref:Acyl-CoA dehydrogenase n=1 Tax=Gordonia jinghuaiqii TaxID=2758710 RepID=A0A7D7QZ10_9ACTN|nr:acyl-CoA dehydrogenase family protein [Gordonia jinghuaiqii]MCR5980589.1 acyl-CoA dehydrogenase [Gordonia jinghuaiqii]QMT02648.1 acyl-CoA dehydrogenase [Gordonia jinghuaiqii]
MDADDVTQVTESLRRALQTDPDNARDAVGEFGWTELLDDEPMVAVRTLFPLWGELLAHGSMLDEVMAHATGIADLDPTTRVALPALGGSDVPGTRRGDSVILDGLIAPGSGPVLVAATSESGAVALVVVAAPPAQAGDPLDPTMALRRIRGEFTVIAEPVADAPIAWASMLAAGRRALAHELNGVTGAMKAMTVEHVLSREQFGQALGSFQAVKHQLADVHLWHQVAELSAAAAWEDGGVRQDGVRQDGVRQDGGAQSAALAKVSANRASATARRVCQQLLGGMGFTWEHDFHRYLRRALTLEPLLGGVADLHGELGAALRDGRLGHQLISL